MNRNGCGVMANRKSIWNENSSRFRRETLMPPNGINDMRFINTSPNIHSSMIQIHLHFGWERFACHLYCSQQSRRVDHAFSAFVFLFISVFGVREHDEHILTIWNMKYRVVRVAASRVDINKNQQTTYKVSNIHWWWIFHETPSNEKQKKKNRMQNE